MSANWKNPFLSQKEAHLDEDGSKKKSYSKDHRVSCEAIPEEIAGMGTTPPSHESIQPPIENQKHIHQHPTLLSCYSYPGSSAQPDSQIPPKSCQTVPQSPNVMQTNAPLNLSVSSIKDSQSSLKSFKSISIESYSSEKGPERPTTLGALPVLIGKPPQSPTSSSPRMLRHSTGHDAHKPVLEKSSSLTNNEKSKLEHQSNDDQGNGQKRDRGYTISVMSPVRKPKMELLKDKSLQEKDNKEKEKEKKKDPLKSGVNSSFIFLHLYHSAQCEPTSEKPLLISSNDIIQRAMRVNYFY